MRYEKGADVANYIFLTKEGQVDPDGYINRLYCAPHFHKAKEFLFLTKGVLPVRIGGLKVECEAGDICFVDSFAPHSYNKSDADGYALILGKEYFSVFEVLFARKTLPCLMRDKEKNNCIFEIVKQWFLQGTSDILKNYSNVYAMLSLMVETYGVESKSESMQGELVFRIMKYIEDNIRNDFSLEDIANSVGYSSVYCSSIFNKFLGEGLRDYINRSRIYNIQFLLSSSGTHLNDNTILQIALNNGFNSQSTFYRAYKKVYGKTPKENLGYYKY